MFYIVALLALPSLLWGAFSIRERQPNWRHTVIENHENGNPKLVIFHEAGEPVKEVILYPNGAIKSEADLIGDHYHGGCRLFHANGALAKRCVYSQGQLDGPVESFYPGGQVESRCSYCRGEKEGAWLQLYDNGNKK